MVVPLQEYDYDTLGDGSELGFPLPNPKLVDGDQITISFEGCTILWSPHSGFSHQLY